MNFRLLAAPRNSGVKYWELPIFFDSYEFNQVGGNDTKLIDWIRLGYIRPTKDKERRVARAFYTPTPLIANLHKKLRRSLYQMEVVGVEWLKLSLSKTAVWRLCPAGYIKRVGDAQRYPADGVFCLRKAPTHAQREANRPLAPSR